MSSVLAFATRKKKTAASPVKPITAAPAPAPASNAGSAKKKPQPREVIDLDAETETENARAAVEVSCTPPTKPTPTTSPAAKRTAASFFAAATASASAQPSVTTSAKRKSLRSAAANDQTNISSATATGTAAAKKLKLSPALKPVAVAAAAVDPELKSTNSAPAPKNARSGVLAGYWSDVSDTEVLLRKFDLDARFGPSMGVTRRERWLRADKYDLNPPLYVWKLLNQPATAAGAKSARSAATASKEVVQQTSMFERSLN